MEFCYQTKKVIFDLPPGVYTADSESAIGKTYSYKLLDGFKSLGDKSIFLLTFSIASNMREEDIIAKIHDTSYRVIFLDRADLYLTEDIITTILSNRTAVIYVDTKSSNKFGFSGRDCLIDFKEGCITYYEDNI